MQFIYVCVCVAKALVRKRKYILTYKVTSVSCIFEEIYPMINSYVMMTVSHVVNFPC